MTTAEVLWRAQNGGNQLDRAVNLCRAARAQGEDAAFWAALACVGRIETGNIWLIPSDAPAPGRFTVAFFWEAVAGVLLQPDVRAPTLTRALKTVGASAGSDGHTHMPVWMLDLKGRVPTWYAWQAAVRGVARDAHATMSLGPACRSLLFTPWGPRGAGTAPGAGGPLTRSVLEPWRLAAAADAEPLAVLRAINSHLVGPAAAWWQDGDPRHLALAQAGLKNVETYMTYPKGMGLRVWSDTFRKAV